MLNLGVTRLNIVPISFAQLRTSILDVVDVSADHYPLYSEKHPIRSNFLRTDVLLRSARISQHCVYKGAASHPNRHRTRDFKVGSACLLVRQKGSARFPPFMDAFTESLISETISTLKIYLPVCHWR